MRTRRDTYPRLRPEILESRTLLSASYKIVDIGVLPGGTTSAAYGLNQAGIAVGNADVANGNIDAFQFAAGAVPAIGKLAGGAITHAYAINSQRDVVGETQVGKYQHAFLYTHGIMRDLGTLGGLSSFAYSIDDADTVVGGSYIRGNNLVHAFVWTPATGMKDLGTLGGGFSLAYAITAAGQITGYSTNSRGQNHAFLYNAGKMHDLGTIGGSTLSVAYAMNAGGQIVGSVKIANTENAFLYAAGKFVDLGTLGGISSTAYGINRSGTIVGLSALKGSSTTHAFEYSGGKMYDLNREIDPNSGWTLLGAFAINDAGQIAGMGMIHGQIHGFILKPI